MDKPKNRIKEVLEEKGIKQTWLAEKLGRVLYRQFLCLQQTPTEFGGAVRKSQIYYKLTQRFD